MLLDIEGLTKEFGGLCAVNNVSLHLSEGEVVGLIGPNGAGKTTLFHCISGFLQPTRFNKIHFQGQSIAGLKPYRRCQLGMARTFQIAKPFPGLTVLEAVTIAAHVHLPDARKAETEAARVLDFVEFRGSIHAQGKDLSVVNRKRLEVARALATSPRLLLLDEVLAGLNPTEIAEAIQLIHKIVATGVSVIMVEHVLQAVMAVANRIVVLYYGEKIAEGDPHTVVRNPQVIEAYLGRRAAATLAAH